MIIFLFYVNQVNSKVIPVLDGIKIKGLPEGRLCTVQTRGNMKGTYYTGNPCKGHTAEITHERDILHRQPMKGAYWRGNP